jgi:hypothetical protein
MEQWRDGQGTTLPCVCEDPVAEEATTTLTDSKSAYTFPEVLPDTYVLLEMIPSSGYPPGDVSDFDCVNNGDAEDLSKVTYILVWHHVCIVLHSRSAATTIGFLSRY